MGQVFSYFVPGIYFKISLPTSFVSDLHFKTAGQERWYFNLDKHNPEQTVNQISSRWGWKKPAAVQRWEGAAGAQSGPWGLRRWLQALWQGSHCPPPRRCLRVRSARPPGSRAILLFLLRGRLPFLPIPVTSAVLLRRWRKWLIFMLSLHRRTKQASPPFFSMQKNKLSSRRCLIFIKTHAYLLPKVNLSLAVRLAWRSVFGKCTW